MTELEVKTRKTGWVVILTFAAMVVEIIFGIITGSMALLADGIHMASHVLAIGLSWIAYILVRRLAGNENFRGDRDKILSLSGFTSGLFLLFFALFIMVEAVGRFLDPVDINYIDALIVASSGLLVNIISAWVLHHDKKHSDNNIRAAYLHVLADALTSLTAIIGLTVAMIWSIAYLDTVAATISSIVIIRWAVGLLKDAGSELLDIRKPNLPG